MGEMTVKAKNELEREKVYSPQEALEYLQKRENFRFISETIKELMRQRGTDGDDGQILKAFRKLMRENDVAPKKSETSEGWFEDKVLPSKEYAIKMCFAFELSSKTRPTAAEFLWNTCQINGFNFRRVEDVVCYYALERGKPYYYAKRLLEKYTKVTDERIFADGDETKSTSELWDIFSYLDIMPEDEFVETLCENKKNFIGYRKMAHDEFVKIYDGLISLIGKDIEESNISAKEAPIPGYGENPVAIYSEVVFDKTLEAIASIKGAKGEKRSVLLDISDKFPIAEYINALYHGTKYDNPNAKSENYDKEYGFARKVFVFCFFARYIIEWERYLSDIRAKGESPKRFYTDFYRRLNSLLNKCTYALIYPRNPFDWLILNCVRSLDSADQDHDLDAQELFNETLGLLVSE